MLGHGPNSTGAGPALTVHAACGKSWKQRGNRTGHCSGCHQTFEGVTLFDQHRRGGVCADPRSLTAEGLPLIFDGTHGDGSWRADASRMKAGFKDRESTAAA
ncbi:hypothetical protein ACI3KS_05250 [Microbacterium sp. ZW T5_45]|uniref:FDXHR family putative zinc-binding protein n=1 Tax=Microbacterium sp. ZW T5_45 TaxID=3378080 RepID=UPI00385442D5